MDFWIQMSSEGEQDADGCEFYYQCKCFIVVEAFNLGVSFCNNPTFASLDESFGSLF
jgi:hypothetical protein